MVKEPFEKAFSMSNVKAGFKKCGIYPFDPNVIDKEKMKPSEMYNRSHTSSLNSSLDSERNNSDKDEPVMETDDVNDSVSANDNADRSCDEGNSCNILDKVSEDIPEIVEDDVDKSCDEGNLCDVADNNVSEDISETVEAEVNAEMPGPSQNHTDCSSVE